MLKLSELCVLEIKQPCKPAFYASPNQISEARGSVQWHRNEFESGGGHMSGAKHHKNCWLYPSTFWLYKYNQSFWWALLCGQFLVCCSTTRVAPCAQPFVKGGHVPPPCPTELAPVGMFFSVRLWIFFGVAGVLSLWLVGFGVFCVFWQLCYRCH